MKAAVRLEHQLLSIESEHDVHAMVELTVPDAGDAASRPPLRLALVLDRSGSMAGPKLAVRKTLRRLARRAPAPRRTSSRSSASTTRCGCTRRSRPCNGALRSAIASLRPGGSTNLSGGWLKGLEQLRAAPADGVRKILLLTDGLANVGISDAGCALAARRDGRGRADRHHDDRDRLRLRRGAPDAMADAGGGNAHYAETADAAPAIFSRELDGLTQVAAQNVSIEIRPCAEVQVLGILNEYPHVAVPGGVQVALGDAYAGEKRRIVFELHVPHLAALGPAKVAELVLRYVSVGEPRSSSTS